MKILRIIRDNILFFATLFLLAFIPLYPKIPAIGITHTWVYIRLDDFVVALTYAIYLILLVFRRAKLKTPLTVPIILFWIVGLVSTVYAVIFIFPTLTNVFPSLAALNYLRRIEYLGLFFVAYSAIRDKKQLKYLTWILTLTLIAVVIYGFGQRYFGFPAYLTGNEEFAKGIPLLLSAKDRIASTFAGHYDLAAWLVMLITLMAAFAVGYKKWYLKIIFALSGFFGLILLLMTASRVSFVAYLVSVSFFFLLVKRKRYILPVIILSILMLHFFDGISQRFLRTVSSVDTVVNLQTGQVVGIVSGTDKTGQPIINEKQSTGEELPQGSGYINLPGGITSGTKNTVTYSRTKISNGVEETNTKNLKGQFAIRKSLAYDISFTTRLQGTWPRAVEAFERNPLLGSGYSSISLASDNNYLRILGEVGILGLLSYASIFLFYSIFVYKVVSSINSKAAKSFVLGVSASLLGLALNAFLIDIFEASKVAYPMWLLMGASLGVANLYRKEKINYARELGRTLSSIWAVGLYLLLITASVFGMIVKNYFTADDFTWLRWVADCKKITHLNGLSSCQPVFQTIVDFITKADGFFFRPGTKIYFYFMYSIFWLNSSFYHVVSIVVHFLTALFVYVLAQKLLKNKLFAFISALFFVVFSVHFESVFWISSTGHLIAAFCMLFSLVTYIYWRENKAWILLVLSLLSAFAATFFHEFAVVMPLLIIAFDLCFSYKKDFYKKWKKGIVYLPYIVISAIYLFMRFMANSHWSGGDYSYNLPKLPLNTIGNTIGYLGMTIFGPAFQDTAASLRAVAKSNSFLLIVGVIIAILIIVFAVFLVKKYFKKYLFKILLFSVLFFLINLLPFLGLGNIAPRYDYLPSVGIAIIMALILMVIVNQLKKFSKPVAYGLLLIFVCLYSFLNIYKLIKINEDWYKAGNITQNLQTGLSNFYSDPTALPRNPVFYFADVPIKTGSAWVFPVGLPDAIWFTFQDSNVTVNLSQSLDEAFRQSAGSSSARVFQFNKDGGVENVTKNTPK